MVMLKYVERYGLGVEDAKAAGIEVVEIEGLPHISIPMLLPDGTERGKMFRRATPTSDEDHEWRWRRTDDPIPTIGCWNLDRPGAIWILESPSDGLALMAHGIPCITFTGVRQSLSPENIEEARQWIGDRIAFVCGDDDQGRPTNWGELFNLTISQHLGVPILRLPEGYKDVDGYLNRKGDV